MLRRLVLFVAAAPALMLTVVSCAPEAAPLATAPSGPGSSAGAPPVSASAGPAVAASTALLPPPATPDAIAVIGTPVLLKAAAKGVQIYSCKAKEGAATFEWSFTGPDAQLFDDKGQAIGRHYAGPTWELRDGSKVIGKLHSKVDAPEPSAIAWLSLDAKETQGTGLLTRVKNIQRVGTVGGKAPSTGCDAAHAGTETRVDYTATYYFYGS